MSVRGEKGGGIEENRLMEAVGREGVLENTKSSAHFMRSPLSQSWMTPYPIEPPIPSILYILVVLRLPSSFLLSLHGSSSPNYSLSSANQ